MQDPQIRADARRLSPSDAVTRFEPSTEANPNADPETSLAPEMRYGFRIGRYGFLSRAGLTGEVVTAPVIYRIPLAPAWVAGVINQRGNIVPVFDLKSLVEGSPDDGDQPAASSAGSSRTLVVLGKADEAVGIFVDALPRSLAPSDERPPASIKDTFSAALAEYIRPAFMRDGIVWLELDYAGLFRSLALNAPLASASGAASEAIGTTADVVGD